MRGAGSATRRATRAEEVRASCQDLLATLKHPDEDVVGDWRLCRFLRCAHQDVQQASKLFRSHEERSRWD